MITAELIQQTESRFAERQAIRQEHEAKILPARFWKPIRRTASSNAFNT